MWGQIFDHSLTFFRVRASVLRVKPSSQIVAFLLRNLNGFIKQSQRMKSFVYQGFKQVTTMFAKLFFSAIVVLMLHNRKFKELPKREARIYV